MNRLNTIFLTSVFFLFSLQAFTQQPSGQKPTEIIILHANDMHAKIDNMAKLAYLADSLRRFHADVFLVAAGDNFTGNPVVDMIPDKGYPMIDLMNRCGFDVSAVGNHEFDMGQDFLNKRLDQAKFPFICCNADASGAMVHPFSPYLVLNTKNGISIALLGIIQLDENGLPSSHPSKMTGIRFTSGIAKAKEYTWLKERYGILVALSHLGVLDDKVLADSIPQFDLIIGGHSHTLLEQPLMENGVMIVQAGSGLKYIGKTTLQVENGHVISRQDEVIPLSVLKKENQEVRKLIDRYNDNKEFSKVIGEAEKPLSGPDELGSLMTDALTSQLNVDFAFQNRGGIRSSEMIKGDITLKDLYKLDPFNNQVVIFKMNAEEIRSLICYGYKLEKDIDLQVSGMTYTLTDNGKGLCAGVTMNDNTGKPLDQAREYTVAMNNYMAVTYKFDHRDPGSTSSLTTAEALTGYLDKVKKVNYSGVKRAVLITQ
ncbi:MAG: bifunctional UDP-sugar hydrolase/5'-nucleotidase [Bacteroidota bacterium]